MSELQPRSRQLLDELTAGSQISAADRASVWEQLQASVERDAPPRIGEAQPVAETGSGRRLWLAIGIGGALAAGLALWMVSTLTPMSAISPAKEPIQAGYARASAEAGGEAHSASGRTTAVVPESDEEEAEPTAGETEAEPASSSTAGESRSRRRRSSSRSGKRRKDTPSASTGDLRAEMALLQSARRSLAAGRYGKALEQLRDHQSKYPGSVFGEERVLLKLKSLCGAGRIDAARTLLSTRRGAQRTELEKACPAAVAPSEP